MRRRTKVLGILLLGLIAGVSALGLAMSHNSPCVAAPPAQPGGRFMNAIVYRCYGSPYVAKVESVSVPVPGEHEVLIKVHAASINAMDWHLVRGQPYPMRLGSGWNAPNGTRLGTDFAGTIEAVGAKVTRFKPGDRVFGGAQGTFADLFIEGQDGPLELMPGNVSFEQAATVPVAGLTALQAVRDYGKLRPGEKVLVNGAAGGVGSFAVQIAKALGGEVTAVTSTANMALVRAIGADHVIDYTREDFTRGTQRYQLIIDCGGGHSMLDFHRALTAKGTYVAIGEANMGRWIEPFANLLVKPPLMSALLSQQYVAFISNLNRADLATLRDLLQAGKVQPVIDRRYPLSRTGEALAYLETGQARGKVVITVD